MYIYNVYLYIHNKYTHMLCKQKHLFWMRLIAIKFVLNYNVKYKFSHIKNI